MDKVKWPETGDLLSLTLSIDSPRVTIRRKKRELYLNRQVIALLGDPPSIWAQINPGMGRIQIGARGDYPLGYLGIRGGRATTFADGLFMPEGTYGPVPGEEQTYQFIGKIPAGYLTRGRKHKKRESDGV